MSKDKVIHINRDLSWLNFNDRVLQEAIDASVPLIERIKFLGIFSNNQDEFFRVRVASIKRAIEMPMTEHDVRDLHKNKKTLEKISERVIELQDKFEKAFDHIVEELENQNIFIINEKELTNSQGEFVRTYFQEVVRPCLVPIMLDSAPKFPYLKDRAIYLAIKLSEKKHNGDHNSTYAMMQIPTDVVPRFIQLPSAGSKKFIILLDDVIRYCLKDIFSIFHYEHIEAYTIKITRDAELDMDDDFSKSYTEKLVMSLKKRKKGKPVRVNYDEEIPNDMLNYIVKKLRMKDESNVIPGGRYHNFRNFMKFPNVGGENMLYPKLKPLYHPDLKDAINLLNVIKKKDILLAFPYHSYNHILDILREAAIDPKVESIMITLYRVAENSNVAYTLLNAIKNGKKVLVVVELQARFDEENNMYWANKLQEEGATVKFGIPGLKVHSKLFLITRREGHKREQFAHVGTGNFNEGTARLYTDLSLLTANEQITSEVEKVFNFFQVNYKTGVYRHLLVSPFFMRQRIERLIDTEIENARAKKTAYMILKLNSLEDVEMIGKLYDASRAGVKIKIIVRGVCSLIPGIKGMSENIECISILDRFLEHFRLFVFCNNGEEKYYISSADIMTRNLDVRTEVACPIYDKDIQKELRKILDIEWSDNVKARVIDEKMDNHYVKNKAKKIRSQDEIYNYFYHKLHGAKKGNM